MANLNINFDQYTKICIFASGGSILGAKSILSILEHEKEYIYIDSIIKEEFYEKLAKIDTKTFVIFTSKSGSTTETVISYLEVKKYCLSNNLDFSKNSLIISSANSFLYNLAKEDAVHRLIHSNIPGRFSIFFEPALVPLYIAKVDYKALIMNARKAMEDFILDKAKCDLNKIINLFLHNIHEIIFIHYDSKLQALCEWIIQLYSESLGKSAFAPTPIIAVGSRFEHSELQSYLGGRKNKFINFINLASESIDVSVKYNNIYEHKLNSLLELHKSKTIKHLENKKIPIRNISIENIGYFMAYMMYEILYIPKIINVDPKNQPDVEALKQEISNELLKC